MIASRPSTRRQVNYNTHLWQTAYWGTWDDLAARTQVSIGVVVSLFVVVFGMGWLIEVGQTPRPALTAFFMALGALLLCYAAAFLAHLFYLTPRKLLCEKQKQLLEERSRFGAAIATLESRLVAGSTDRVGAALGKLVTILKPRQFTNPVAGLYEAGVAELEPTELDELCRQLTKRQIANPFAGIPDDAEYWMWLLVSAVERGVRLRTAKDVVDYHQAVQLEFAQQETAAEPTPPQFAPAPTAKTKVKAVG